MNFKKLGKRIVSVGHQPKGENHYNAKINWKKVDEVIFLYESGYPYKTISKLSKVKIPTIAAIVTGRRWTKSPVAKKKFKPRKTFRKLSQSDVSKIKSKYFSGEMSQHQLAKKYSVSQATISEVVNR